MLIKLKKLFALGLVLSLNSCFFDFERSKADFYENYIGTKVPIDYDGNMESIEKYEIFNSNRLMQIESMLISLCEKILYNEEFYKSTLNKIINEWTATVIDLLECIRYANKSIFYDTYESCRYGERITLAEFYRLRETNAIEKSHDIIDKLYFIITNMSKDAINTLLGTVDYKLFMKIFYDYYSKPNSDSSDFCRIIKLTQDNIDIFCGFVETVLNANGMDLKTRISLLSD